MRQGWHASKLTVGLVALFASLFLALGRGTARESESFRIAFSSALFTDVNENDAKAALKVWGQTVAKERGIESDPDPKILKSIENMAHALRSNSADALGITAPEYEILARDVKLAPLFVPVVSGRITEEYLLLVHRDSKIENVGDLQGRGLTVYENPRTSLAPQWLETVLAKRGLKPSVDLFARVSRVSKLPKVVLPVFFRQNDACVVSRSGYETMVELNPQIGKQLKTLETSPPLVPAVFCFRVDYSPAFKSQLMAGVRELHTSAAGHQVLTIFQCEKMEECPASALQTTLDLLAEHRRKGGTPIRPADPARRSERGGQSTVIGANP